MTDELKPSVSLFFCGPSNQKCKCECPNGPCEHVWDGPSHTTENSDSASCSRCGANAMAHDMWVMP